MASLIGYCVPAGEPAVNNTPNNVSSAEIVLGNNAIFEVTTNGTTAAYIKFGNAGMAVATANDILLPQNFQTLWETGSAFDRVRVFSPTGSTIVSIQKLSRS